MLNVKKVIFLTKDAESGGLKSGDKIKEATGKQSQS